MTGPKVCPTLYPVVSSATARVKCKWGAEREHDRSDAEEGRAEEHR
jgi:hypothetical protein